MDFLVSYLHNNIYSVFYCIYILIITINDSLILRVSPV
jgi:hypothetical protein